MNMNKIVLTKEENVFLFETYFSMKSYKTCVEKFTKIFDGLWLNKMSILRLVHRFREHGTVTRVPYTPCVRTALTQAKKADMGEITSLSFCIVAASRTASGVRILKRFQSNMYIF